MKKILQLLTLLGLLTVSTTPFLFADNPWGTGSGSSSGSGEIGAASDYIDEDDIEDEYEILAVTRDGYLVIRYKGKIYIFKPKS